MLRNKLIPYLRLDYIKIMEDFQILKINSMEKDELLVHLKNSESWIYDLYLKDHCINLFQRIGGFIPIGLSDNNLYKIDVEKIDEVTLKNGLKKVWENAIGDIDFDIKDFEDLYEKFVFTPLDVLVYNSYIMPKMSKQTLNNSDYQLILIFDEKVA